MKYCAKCGRQMPDAVRFCASCGTPQPDVKLRELSARLDRQAAELEAVRKELRGLQAAGPAPVGTSAAAPTPGQQTGRPAAASMSGQQTERPAAASPTSGQRNSNSAAPRMTAPSAQRKQHAGNAGTPGGIEFNIAATVLSVIGVLFLISALMIFGASFLSGMAQGLFLFVVFAALTAVSELWIRKRLPRFAEITSALGLAGLYAAALINYYSLKTLPGPAVLAVTLIISGFAVWLSRHRDSLMLRLVLFLGSYTALIMTGEETPGLIAAFLTFFINLAAALLPVRRNREICSGIHMIAYAAFTIFLQLQSSEWSLFGHYTLEAADLLPVVLFLTVMECIRLLGREQAEDPGKKNAPEKLGMVLLWYFIVGLTILISLLFADCSETWERLMTAGMFSIPFILGTAAGVLALKRGSGELYRGAYTLIIIWMMICAAGQEGVVAVPVCITAMAVSLLIARRDGSSSLITLHLAITIAAFVTASTAGMGAVPNLWVVMALAGFVLFFFQPGYFSAHAAALTLYIVCAIHEYHLGSVFVGYKGSLYKHLLCSAVILVLTLILQRIPKKRDSLTVLYGQVMLILILLHHECLRDCDLHLVYVLFLMIGSAAVFLLCGEKLRLPGRSGKEAVPAGNQVPGNSISVGLQTTPADSREFRIPVPGWLLYAVYLTYMILVIDIPVPVWISILLLALACVCVGLGFRMKLRCLRLYGLGLAIFACIKIAVYDFGDLSSGMRVGVFLAAGLLALLISFIYIRLEKKESRNTGNAGMQQTRSSGQTGMQQSKTPGKDGIQ